MQYLEFEAEGGGGGGGRMGAGGCCAGLGMLDHRSLKWSDYVGSFVAHLRFQHVDAPCTLCELL